MDKVVSEAVKQALRFFQGLMSGKDLAEGAEKVMQVAEKVARKGR